MVLMPQSNNPVLKIAATEVINQSSGNALTPALSFLR